MSADPRDDTVAQTDEVGERMPPMMARSLEAFRRDLPELLETHYHQWVAYHGDQRLFFGRTQTKLYERCLRRGLEPDEFMVCSIEPEIADEDITWSYGW